jgi:DNA-directed RNA polymerase omega subunit
MLGKKPMLETKKTKSNGAGHPVINNDPWPGIDSSFRLIIVAAKRSKQLLNGSLPRIEAEPGRRRNTSIALEEVRRGLVPFTTFTRDQYGNRNAAEDQE